MSRTAEKFSPPNQTQDQKRDVRDILHLLTKTVSAYKIFPAEHATVRQFLQELAERLKSFLDKAGSLDLRVGENYFEFAGERLFEEEDTGRSLPFFFFRDGLQRLSFHRDLDESELAEFLKTIKHVSLLPPEEADIVTAFWEKNFENISFYAPDEFIIDKIASGRPLPEYEVNRDELFSGRLELSEDDKQAVEMWRVAQEKETATGEVGGAELSALKDEAPAEIAQEEWKTIEHIILGYRHLPVEEELARLLLEILYLEDRPDQLPLLKDSLHQAHEQLIQKGKWEAAASFLQDLTALQKISAPLHPEKIKLLDAFFHDLETNERLKIIQEAWLKKIPASKQENLVSYLESLGRSALPLLASLSECIPPQVFNELAFPLLKTWAGREPATLIRLAEESKPHLTRLIISVLSQQADRQVITFLASFISSRQPALRKQAVEALARVDLPAAKKVLLAFLSDKEEEIRCLAAQSLSLLDEISLEHFLPLVEPAALKKKSLVEARVFLQALARSSHSKVKASFLRLCQQRWFLNRGMKRLALLAIEVLQETATPASREILEAIAASGRPVLRRLSREALSSWPAEETRQGKRAR